MVHVHVMGAMGKKIKIKTDLTKCQNVSEAQAGPNWELSNQVKKINLEEIAPS